MMMGKSKVISKELGIMKRKVPMLGFQIHGTWGKKFQICIL